ncbi:MAG TPA: type VI secretion system tube protein Hcp [Terriglobales bacterium]|nr:type VI secretion system tube protein Hcp [Terriglobales bacterium]
MAINAHLKVSGLAGGRIANPGDIDIVSFSWSAIAPRDAATGQPVGKRQLRPLQITKQVDKTTVFFFQLLATNARIDTVELAYDKPVKGGKQEVYFSVKLSKASIASQEVSQAASTMVTHPAEVITFTYEEIEIMYKGEKAEGYLEGPVVASDRVT